MRRRDFVTLVGGSVLALPVSAHAQQSAKAIVGVLDAASAEGDADLIAAFRQALNETGYVEGQNVAIEYRWAEGKYDRLPALSTELIELQPAVLLALGLPAALSMTAATATIPIVFVSVDLGRRLIPGALSICAPAPTLGLGNPRRPASVFGSVDNPPWKRQGAFPSSTLTKHVPPAPLAKLKQPLCPHL
jgi:hypothetical protein